MSVPLPVEISVFWSGRWVVVLEAVENTQTVGSRDASKMREAQVSLKSRIWSRGRYFRTKRAVNFGMSTDSFSSCFLRLGTVPKRDRVHRFPFEGPGTFWPCNIPASGIECLIRSEISRRADLHPRLASGQHIALA